MQQPDNPDRRKLLKTAAAVSAAAALTACGIRVPWRWPDNGASSWATTPTCWPPTCCAGSAKSPSITPGELSGRQIHPLAVDLGGLAGHHIFIVGPGAQVNHPAALGAE